MEAVSSQVQLQPMPAMDPSVDSIHILRSADTSQMPTSAPILEGLTSEEDGFVPHQLLPFGKSPYLSRAIAKKEKLGVPPRHSSATTLTASDAAVDAPNGHTAPKIGDNFVMSDGSILMLRQVLSCGHFHLVGSNNQRVVASPDELQGIVWDPIEGVWNALRLSLTPQQGIRPASPIVLDTGAGLPSPMEELRPNSRLSQSRVSKVPNTFRPPSMTKSIPILDFLRKKGIDNTSKKAATPELHSEPTPEAAVQQSEVAQASRGSSQESTLAEHDAIRTAWTGEEQVRTQRLLNVSAQRATKLLRHTADAMSWSKSDGMVYRVLLKAAFVTAGAQGLRSLEESYEVINKTVTEFLQQLNGRRSAGFSPERSIENGEADEDPSRPESACALVRPPFAIKSRSPSPPEIMSCVEIDTEQCATTSPKDDACETTAPPPLDDALAVRGSNPSASASRPLRSRASSASSTHSSMPADAHPFLAQAQKELAKHRERFSIKQENREPRKRSGAASATLTRMRKSTQSAHSRQFLPTAIRTHLQTAPELRAPEFRPKSALS